MIAAYPELFSYGAVALDAKAIEHLDFIYLLRGELCPTASVTVSALSNAVRDIFRSTSGEKMTGEYAEGVVAAVANIVAFGNLAIEESEAHAMGIHIFPFADKKMPVSVTRLRSSPEPAS